MQVAPTHAARGGEEGVESAEVADEPSETTQKLSDQFEELRTLIHTGSLTVEELEGFVQACAHPVVDDPDFDW